jgi:hypothetical protein
MAFSPSHSPARSSQYAKTNDIRPGRHSNIFRPPLTPSSASAEHERRQSSFTPRYASSTASSSNRKRPRADSSRTSLATPYSISSNTWTNVPSTRDSMLRSDCASPPPLVNTTYNLAGGLETPSAATDSYFDSRENTDFGVRRRWRASSNAQEAVPGVEAHMALGGDRNGKTRYEAPTSQSWRQFMFGIVGGVAGKVWEICTTTAFKGFHAGGGEGYNLTPSSNDEPRRAGSGTWEDVEIPRTFDRCSTPIPGQYPDEDDIDARPAKRLHTEKGSEWVIIDSLRDTSQASTPLSRARRKAPTPNPNPTRPALTSRRSLVPVSRRTSGIMSTLESPIPSIPARPASFAHQRAAGNLTPSKATPLSPETQRYMAERRREERQADASIRRLNEQLKAMIKEGKQALGTKVEVLDDVEMEDEGYFESNK